MDSSVHFTLSESGVSRITGKGWSTAKKVGKGLGSLAVLGGLLSGNIGYGPASLSQHYLSAKAEERQIMRWKDVRKIDVNEEKHIISLCDDQGNEIRLRSHTTNL